MFEHGILYSNENEWPTATHNMEELHKQNWWKKFNIKHVPVFYWIKLKKKLGKLTSDFRSQDTDYLSRAWRGYTHEKGFRGLVLSVQFLDMGGVVTGNSLSYTLIIGIPLDK